MPLQKSHGTRGTRVSNSISSKVEQYLSEKFDFRLNVVTQQCEILVKGKYDIWEKVNVSELRGHLDRHGIACSLDVIKWTSGRALTESYGFGLTLKLHIHNLHNLPDFVHRFCLIKGSFNETTEMTS